MLFPLLPILHEHRLGISFADGIINKSKIVDEDGEDRKVSPDQSALDLLFVFNEGINDKVPIKIGIELVF